MWRRILLIAWCLAPVALLIFHFGPGLKMAERDKAADIAVMAQAAEKRQDWLEALNLYNRAIDSMPPKESGQLRQLRFARAQVLIMNCRNRTAILELELLDDELDKIDRHSRIHWAVRSELAHARYCVARIIRLKAGTETPRGEWQTLAKQSKRLLEDVAEASKRFGKADEEEQHRRKIIEITRFETSSYQEFKSSTAPSDCGVCRAEGY